MATQNNISLFIPRISPNFTGDDIAKIFKKLKIGIVDMINFVSKIDRNGRRYKSAYIRFESWFEGTIAANFQARVLNPKKEARIVYDDPKYWVVLPDTQLNAYKNVWMPTTDKPTTVDNPTTVKEPKWVLLSLEQEKALEADIEAAWDENYVLKAELKKIREGDDAKINDLRLAMRRLETQAKKDADEIYNLQIELSEQISQVRELENLLDQWEQESQSHSVTMISDNNFILREKVADLENVFRSILSPQTDNLTDAKDQICHQLYNGLTYFELMAKPKE